MTKQSRSENQALEQSQKRKKHDALRLPILLMEEQHKLNGQTPQTTYILCYYHYMCFINWCSFR
jgi:hypothetical protein